MIALWPDALTGSVSTVQYAAASSSPGTRRAHLGEPLGSVSLIRYFLFRVSNWLASSRAATSRSAASASDSVVRRCCPSTTRNSRKSCSGSLGCSTATMLPMKCFGISLSPLDSAWYCSRMSCHRSSCWVVFHR